MAEKIKQGDFINLDYVGRVKGTGKIFDLTSEELAKKENLYTEEARYGPVTVVVGANHLVKGLDKKLIDLETSAKETIVVSPEEGFGKRSPDLIKLVPRSTFKRNKINPIPGLPVEVNNQRGIVLTVSGGRIKVDFNHPLAGRELEYEVELHKKITDKTEQIKSLINFHVPKAELKDLKIEFKQGTAEITTPEDQKTRRYINLTEEYLARDILKYIKDVNKTKFIDVFESKK